MNSSRPIERKLSSAYSRVLQIGGFQTVRIRAKSSNIFFNKYKNGNAFPNVYSFIIHYKNCIIDYLLISVLLREIPDGIENMQIG